MRSDHAPDGTSNRNEVTDQMMNSDDIAVGDTPWSRNNSE